MPPQTPAMSLPWRTRINGWLSGSLTDMVSLLASRWLDVWQETLTSAISFTSAARHKTGGCSIPLPRPQVSLALAPLLRCRLGVGHQTLAGPGDDLAAVHHLAHRLADRHAAAAGNEVLGIRHVQIALAIVVADALHPILLGGVHRTFGADPLRAEAAHLVGAGYLLLAGHVLALHVGHDLGGVARCARGLGLVIALRVLHARLLGSRRWRAGA